ncbi:hypothetical protein [Spiroplasma endosymbiont of Agriotes lineatus]
MWNAIITAFTKMWEIIAVNMPQVGNFFADYWIFIFRTHKVFLGR